MGIKKTRSSKSDQTVLESARCREIVSEILNFGVSQHQLLVLIKLISLEVDDIQLMKSIAELVDAKLEGKSITKNTTIIT